MMKRIVCAAFVGILALAGLPAGAQQVIQGQPLTGAQGITISVAEIEKQALQAEALRQQQGPITKIREELSAKRQRKPVLSAKALPGATYPKTSEPIIAAQNTQGLHSNFSALRTGETAGITITPPDCMGDVGPTQVCIASNDRLKWYSKNTVCETARTTPTELSESVAGSPQFNVYLDDFFGSVRAGESVTDPHVHYDRLSERWFIVAINTAFASNRIMIAVSSGPTITAQSSFTFYQFAHDQGAATTHPDYGGFCDYPTLGVDRNALYVGGVMFDDQSDYVGASVYVVRKTSVLSGGPMVMTPFRQVGTATANIFCAQGVDNDDPAATVGYYVGVSAAFFGELNYLVVTDPGGTPSVTQATIDVPATSFPIDVAAQGSTAALDGGDDRMLNAMLTVDKATGEKAIWASHNIAVGQTGSAEGSRNRNAVRWYKLVANGAAVSLSQSGTLFDNTSAARSYWMGSIAASGQGHAIVGATVAGATAFTNVAYAGRYSSTAAGATFAPVQATNYTTPYGLETTAPQRWGDYSQTVVDPSDDMTMWTFQQFAVGVDASSSRWVVRAVQVKAPPPAAVSAMTTITCTADRTIDVVVNGTAGSNFAGYFDPGADAGGPGFARRLNVSSTGGVTISNVVYNTPTQIAFRLNYAAATLGSQQTLTITNPDCQSVTFNYTLPTGCSALPVKWLGISAAWNSNNGVVRWKVSNEQSLRGYEVERSTDGVNYSTIGTVAPKNAAEANYVFTDLNAANTNYYRVKQIDRDGQFTYSGVAALVRGQSALLRAYPNPAKDQVQILLPAFGGSFRMIDANGKVVYSTAVQGNVLNIAVSQYARGLYAGEYAGEDGKTERLKIVLQ